MKNPILKGFAIATGILFIKNLAQNKQKPEEIQDLIILGSVFSIISFIAKTISED